MKVNDKGKYATQVKTLSCGALFTVNGGYFMRISGVATHTAHPRLNPIVNVENGDTTYIGENELVTPLVAKIEIGEGGYESR